MVADSRHMEEVRRIVLDGLEGLPAVVLARIRERLEESTLPFRVDLVDLTTADEALVKSVMEEGVPWTA
jgi:hypothetical protein